jgi:prepilin-type N-terminal cleavage/methylation domain-containing protein
MNRPSAVIRSSARRISATDAGFTLIELLVVISVIMVLIALLFPAVQAVRNSANKAAAESMIKGLHLAMEIYAGEDRQHRYPAVEADQLLRTRMTTGGGARALDLLRAVGLEWRVEQLAPPMGGGQDCLVDPWGRGYRYAFDPADGTVVRPAPQADWNPKGEEPFAYVWSLGRPGKGGEATDALAANAPNWIYRRTTP